jgi:hypothetical protein
MATGASAGIVGNMDMVLWHSSEAYSLIRAQAIARDSIQVNTLISIGHLKTT